MSKKIEVEDKILSKNDKLANELRQLFLDKKVLVINFVSSPGSGKTSILENILPKLSKKYRLAVIEGDLETENDAERIRKAGIKAYQITTGGACHLEAFGIKNALPNFDLDNLDLLIIENVGNLVCPASFDLGEDFKIVVISTPEGDDKPAKYPSMIRASSAIIVNKIDLAEYMEFDVEKCINYAKQINPNLVEFRTSCKTKTGLDDLIAFIETKIEEKHAGIRG
ncbi:MAG: hydrogenase nickel incorporation protein HypB [Deferribacterales bacterium]|jgi:hydrogenase nickel incorporation protein HypB|nr:hydrogenase nickel incorporation protein HypB [Deferribacterales bacterium]MBZ4672207.1 hydrogenase accessory protein HypB [Deferribacteraceae bacterium]